MYFFLKLANLERKWQHHEQNNFVMKECILFLYTKLNVNVTLRCFVCCRRRRQCCFSNCVVAGEGVAVGYDVAAW